MNKIIAPNNNKIRKKACARPSSGKSLLIVGMRMNERKTKIKTLPATNVIPYSMFVNNSSIWLLNLSTGPNFIRIPFQFLIISYSLFFKKKKDLGKYLACFLVMFLTASNATDHRRLAEKLLRDSQIQMQSVDVESFISSSKNQVQKSFFGFDDDGNKSEGVMVRDHNMSNAPTCMAGSFSSGDPRGARYQGKSGLFIFVSLGMSDEALRALSKQSQAVGGVLVIRGLVNNSFKETQKKLMDLSISIDIDPTLFERFDIKRVPTFVLTRVKGGDIQGPFDKVTGNVSLRSALDLFSMEGELSLMAQSFLKKEQVL